MKILIRTDASVFMGSGHVMRCLTLADELRARGAEIAFACRDFEGNLLAFVRQQGFAAFRLPAVSQIAPQLAAKQPAAESDTENYAAWLGASQEQDAAETLGICRNWGGADWLIVDHYGIDAEWHRQARRGAGARIFCIDDIANRPLDCDALLDQNLYDNPERRYAALAPERAARLLGPRYALLRAEFREALRKNPRKRDGKVRRIFVFFGGSDPTNETAKTLEALRLLKRPDIAADVVAGASNPHRAELEALCDKTPGVRFYCQVKTIAEFMASADLAVGAGGSTTWERCCLGLPTLAVILADNQREMTETAARRGVQWNLGECESVTPERIAEAIRERIASPAETRRISENAQTLTDGLGAQRVADVFFETKPT